MRGAYDRRHSSCYRVSTFYYSQGVTMKTFIVNQYVVILALTEKSAKEKFANYYNESIKTIKLWK